MLPCKVFRAPGNNLPDVDEIMIPNDTAQYYEVAIGEGYGVEINKENQLSYAINRIINIDRELASSFDLIYPHINQSTIYLTI